MLPILESTIRVDDSSRRSANCRSLLLGLRRPRAQSVPQADNLSETVRRERVLPEPRGQVRLLTGEVQGELEPSVHGRIEPRSEVVHVTFQLQQDDRRHGGTRAQRHERGT